MAWCIKKGLGKQRVGKQTSGQIIKGENRFQNVAPRRLSAPVGCVKAMWRYATRRALQKQKRRLHRFPGY